MLKHRNNQIEAAIENSTSSVRSTLPEASLKHQVIYVVELRLHQHIHMYTTHTHTHRQTDTLSGCYYGVNSCLNNLFET